MCLYKNTFISRQFEGVLIQTIPTFFYFFKNFKSNVFIVYLEYEKGQQKVGGF
jgi:hypothetical protein